MISFVEEKKSIDKLKERLINREISYQPFFQGVLWRIFYMCDFRMIDLICSLAYDHCHN